MDKDILLQSSLGIDVIENFVYMNRVTNLCCVKLFSVNSGQ